MRSRSDAVVTGDVARRGATGSDADATDAVSEPEALVDARAGAEAEGEAEAADALGAAFFTAPFPFLLGAGVSLSSDSCDPAMSESVSGLLGEYGLLSTVL